VRRRKEVAQEVEVRCSEDAGVRVWELLSTTPRHAAQIVLSFPSELRYTKNGKQVRCEETGQTDK
jgi:hypothetical protein